MRRFNNYMRIVLDGNVSRLVYKRGPHLFSSLVDSKRSFPLEFAYIRLRREISEFKLVARTGDPMLNRTGGRILEMMRQKRRARSELVFESKKPVNFKKNFGVEIEFVSTSSQRDIAMTLAEFGVAEFVELKTDGSVRGEGSGDCDGGCRDNCECHYCGEEHFCEDLSDCQHRTRNYEGGNADRFWRTQDDCEDCPTETQTIDGVETEVVVCEGHCTGHSCNGYEDHDNSDCHCECDCGGGGERGHEICIVADHTKIKGVVTRVCDALAAHDAKVNDTCGLHVHLDARKRDHALMFSNLVRSIPVLYSMVPETRYWNTFCKPNHEGQLSRCSESDRYWGVNPCSYRKHKTIEVRLHSGTVNSVKINHWIDLLSAIAYNKKSLVKSNTLADFFGQVKVSTKLVEYVRARVEKFAAKRKTKLLDPDNAVAPGQDSIAA